MTSAATPPGSPTCCWSRCARATSQSSTRPGAGIGDDKLTQAYVGEMIRFYLGQEPILPTVRTFDLGDPEQLDVVLGRLGEMVVKPRSGLGGSGVVICRELVRRTTSSGSSG